MNIPQAQTISDEQAKNLLDQAGRLGLTPAYLPKKHQLLLEDGEGWLAKLYLPWTMRWVEHGWAERADPHYSLLLLRAGQAAVGYFHLGELLDHKVFRAYMVRQKQGVSQIKHLKTKGKSRAGSRIRLAETERFFEEINERLNAYADSYPIDFWGISCAKTMWPFYFDSAVSPPFSQKQENLIELPMHVAQASFGELEKAGQLVNRFHLILSGRGEQLLAIVGQGHSPADGDDDW